MFAFKRCLSFARPSTITLRASGGNALELTHGVYRKAALAMIAATATGFHGSRTRLR
jgi:hypothetical protein